MDADDAPPPPGSPAEGPRVVLRPEPLLREEKRRVAIASVAPVGIVFVLFLPFAIWGAASVRAVFGGAIVYGGLLSLASGFVMTDREQGRQCPACRHRNERTATVCGSCAYDLAARPRFACQERHRVHLDPGMCECGRRLQQLPGAGGVGREIVIILKAGAWLLAFLVGMGLLFQYVG